MPFNILFVSLLLLSAIYEIIGRLPVYTLNCPDMQGLSVVMTCVLSTCYNNISLSVLTMATSFTYNYFTIICLQMPLLLQGW